jgi:hypothetical protein
MYYIIKKITNYLEVLQSSPFTFGLLWAQAESLQHFDSAFLYSLLLMNLFNLYSEHFLFDFGNLDIRQCNEFDGQSDKDNQKPE